MVHARLHCACGNGQAAVRVAHRPSQTFSAKTRQRTIFNSAVVPDGVMERLTERQELAYMPRNQFELHCLHGRCFVENQKCMKLNHSGDSP